MRLICSLLKIKNNKQKIQPFVLHILNISGFELIIKNKLGESNLRGKNTVLIILFLSDSIIYSVSLMGRISPWVPKEVSFKTCCLILSDAAKVWCKWMMRTYEWIMGQNLNFQFGEISLFFLILKREAAERGKSSNRNMWHPVISMGGRYQDIFFISISKPYPTSHGEPMAQIEIEARRS